MIKVFGELIATACALLMPFLAAWLIKVIV